MKKTNLLSQTFYFVVHAERSMTRCLSRGRNS